MSPIYDSCSSSLFSQEPNSLCANPDCAALIEVLVSINNLFYNRYMYYFYFSKAVRQPKARRSSAHNGAIISLYYFSTQMTPSRLPKRKRYFIRSTFSVIRSRDNVVRAYCPPSSWRTREIPASHLQTVCRLRIEKTVLGIDGPW